MYVTNLSSAYATRTLCASSDIDRFEFSTDSEALTVQLSHSGTVFYSATLYAYGGRVTAERMDQVIGDYMIVHGLHRAQINVRAVPPSYPEGAVEMQIDTLYCAYTLPEGYNLSVAFFTLLQVQRVPPKAIVPVCGNVPDGADVSLRVSGFKADGTPDSCELTGGSVDGEMALNLDFIARQAANRHGIAEISAVSLFYGDAVKSVVVQNMPSFLEFRFRNCFNCPETVFISGTSQMVTDVSRDQAMCNGKAMQYNHQVIRTYEHTTDPLTRMEAAALTQLVEAREVYLHIGIDDIPIIITDHELKVSSDDSALNSVKFTWRFADSRPRLFGQSLTPLLESFGIFTDQFTQPYQ